VLYNRLTERVIGNGFPLVETNVDWNQITPGSWASTAPGKRRGGRREAGNEKPAEAGLFWAHCPEAN